MVPVLTRRPREYGERLEGGLQLGAVVLLCEGTDDRDDGADDALPAQQRRRRGVSRHGLDDLHKSGHGGFEP